MRHRDTFVGLLLGIVTGVSDLIMMDRLILGEVSSLGLHEIAEHLVLFPLVGLAVGYWADQRRKQLQLRETYLHSLNRASQRVSRWGLDLDSVLQSIVASLVEEIGVAFARIWLAEEGGEELALHASAGLYTRLDGSRARIRLDDYSCKLAQIARERRPLLANRVQEDDRFDRAWARRQGLVAFAGYPLLRDGRLVAVLALFNRQPLEGIMLDVMGSFLSQAAVAIENARLYRELESYSQFLQQAVEERTAELQREKERAEAILDSAADAVFIGDSEGRILSVNPAFEEQTGYRADEVIGRHFRTLADAAAIPLSTIEEDRQAMQAGLPWRGQLVIRRKDGSTYDADVSRAPLPGKDGVQGQVIVMRDISASKELERMKDAFVSNVSHELRTPITGLKLLLDLLKTAPSEKRDGILTSLRRETDRLNLIIEDLLRLSRLDQGAVELKLRAVDLNLLAGQYVTDRAPQAESRGLSLSLDTQPDLPTVNADWGLLGQVLSVLLTNAFNYTPAGGQVVVSTHSRKMGDKTWAGFSVADTGPGIPPDEQKQLFQRFFRGRAGRESDAPGTGLGLSIAKEIVDRHNGRIEVESEGVAGKGTTFSVWLPAGG